MRMFNVVQMEITYVNGSVKVKSLLGKDRSKGWSYVKRMMARKIFQDHKDGKFTPRGSELPVSNKGVGGRFKWQAKYGDVYHKSMEEVVEKHHHVCNAVVITPDSWYNKKLQEVFVSGREKKSEEKTTLM